MAAASVTYEAGWGWTTLNESHGVDGPDVADMPGVEGEYPNPLRGACGPEGAGDAESGREEIGR
ncbi:hypothetical protein GCM10017771_70730 [Streptomyces capitiformicae]|uniref:Uncharacterized protein n=1 Tax=Streptomyces capitiformicae TaxID=2014920 RepID=A0A919DJM3_9ACTN|nr:hypothetical protein GCM10017771_70730 [Streptomyces capitiformicae]